MSRFTGQYLGYKGTHGKTKGVMHQERLEKRAEAEARQKLTPVERTRQYRLHPEKFQDASLLTDETVVVQ
jgi:hypothetical protein